MAGIDSIVGGVNPVVDLVKGLLGGIGGAGGAPDKASQGEGAGDPTKALMKGATQVGAKALEMGATVAFPELALAKVLL